MTASSKFFANVAEASSWRFCFYLCYRGWPVVSDHKSSGKNFSRNTPSSFNEHNLNFGHFHMQYCKQQWFNADTYTKRRLTEWMWTCHQPDYMWCFKDWINNESECEFTVQFVCVLGGGVLSSCVQHSIVKEGWASSIQYDQSIRNSHKL